MQVSTSVLLIEPIWKGHTPTYVERICVNLLRLGVDVTVACPDESLVNRIDSFADPDSSSSLRIIDTSRFGTLSEDTSPRDAYQWWWRCSDYAIREDEKQGRSDIVFFDLIDPAIRSLLDVIGSSFRFPKKWVGLYMQPVQRLLMHGNRRLLRMKSFAESHLLRGSCLHLFTLDEAVAGALSKQWRCSVSVFPDITDLTEGPPETAFQLLPELKNVFRKKRIVGHLGLKARWKGIFSALDVALGAKQEDLHWIFAGPLAMPKEDRRIYEDRLDELSKSGVSYSILHQNIPDGPCYNALMQCCDVVWGCYPGHWHSSNTMVKAAYFKKPCVVLNTGLMHERVKRFNLGEAACIDRDAIVDALRSALKNGFKASDDERSAFLKIHSEATLNAALSRVFAHA